MRGAVAAVDASDKFQKEIYDLGLVSNKSAKKTREALKKFTVLRDEMKSQVAMMKKCLRMDQGSVKAD